MWYSDHFTSMANTLQADFLSACFMATSRPSRSWCWITKARTGHWKFLSPLLREPWAEISRDSSGDGWRNREEPTSVQKTKSFIYTHGAVTHSGRTNKHFLKWQDAITCITTMDPASGHSFDPCWRGWMLLVIFWCDNWVRPLKHRPLSCVTVCDWTGLETKRHKQRNAVHPLNIFKDITLNTISKCWLTEEYMDMFSSYWSCGRKGRMNV